jgi:hypothetical protein
MNNFIIGFATCLLGIWIIAVSLKCLWNAIVRTDRRIK